MESKELSKKGNHKYYWCKKEHKECCKCNDWYYNCEYRQVRIKENPYKDEIALKKKADALKEASLNKLYWCKKEDRPCLNCNKKYDLCENRETRMNTTPTKEENTDNWEHWCFKEEVPCYKCYNWYQYCQYRKTRREIEEANKKAQEYERILAKVHEERVGKEKVLIEIENAKDEEGKVKDYNISQQISVVLGAAFMSLIPGLFVGLLLGFLSGLINVLAHFFIMVFLQDYDTEPNFLFEDYFCFGFLLATALSYPICTMVVDESDSYNKDSTIVITFAILVPIVLLIIMLYLYTRIMAVVVFAILFALILVCCMVSYRR